VVIVGQSVEAINKHIKDNLIVKVGVLYINVSWSMGVRIFENDKLI
jgi:hypothetical protein